MATDHRNGRVNKARPYHENHNKIRQLNRRKLASWRYLEDGELFPSEQPKSRKLRDRTKRAAQSTKKQGINLVIVILSGGSAVGWSLLVLGLVTLPAGGVGVVFIAGAIVGPICTGVALWLSREQRKEVLIRKKRSREFGPGNCRPGRKIDHPQKYKTPAGKIVNSEIASTSPLDFIKTELPAGDKATVVPQAVAKEPIKPKNQLIHDLLKAAKNLADALKGLVISLKGILTPKKEDIKESEKFELTQSIKHEDPLLDVKDIPSQNPHRQPGLTEISEANKMPANIVEGKTIYVSERKDIPTIEPKAKQEWSDKGVPVEGEAKKPASGEWYEGPEFKAKVSEPRELVGEIAEPLDSEQVKGASYKPTEAELKEAKGRLNQVSLHQLGPIAGAQYIADLKSPESAPKNEASPLEPVNLKHVGDKAKAITPSAETTQHLPHTAQALGKIQRKMMKATNVALGRNITVNGARATQKTGKTKADLLKAASALAEAVAKLTVEAKRVAEQTNKSTSESKPKTVRDLAAASHRLANALAILSQAVQGKPNTEEHPQREDKSLVKQEIVDDLNVSLEEIIKEQLGEDYIFQQKPDESVEPTLGSGQTADEIFDDIDKLLNGKNTDDKELVAREKEIKAEVDEALEALFRNTLGENYEAALTTNSEGERASSQKEADDIFTELLQEYQGAGQTGEADVDGDDPSATAKEDYVKQVEELLSTFEEFYDEGLKQESLNKSKQKETPTSAGPINEPLFSVIDEILEKSQSVSVSESNENKLGVELEAVAETMQKVKKDMQAASKSNNSKKLTELKQSLADCHKKKINLLKGCIASVEAEIEDNKAKLREIDRFLDDYIIFENQIYLEESKQGKGWEPLLNKRQFDRSQAGLLAEVENRNKLNVYKETGNELPWTVQDLIDEKKNNVLKIAKDRGVDVNRTDLLEVLGDLGHVLMEEFKDLQYKISSFETELAARKAELASINDRVVSKAWEEHAPLSNLGEILIELSLKKSEIRARVIKENPALKSGDLAQKINQEMMNFVRNQGGDPDQMENDPGALSIVEADDELLGQFIYYERNKDKNKLSKLLDSVNEKEILLWDKIKEPKGNFRLIDLEELADLYSKKIGLMEAIVKDIELRLEENKKGNPENASESNSDLDKKVKSVLKNEKLVLEMELAERKEALNEEKKRTLQILYNLKQIYIGNLDRTTGNQKESVQSSATLLNRAKDYVEKAIANLEKDLESTTAAMHTSDLKTADAQKNQEPADAREAARSSPPAPSSNPMPTRVRSVSSVDYRHTSAVDETKAAENKHKAEELQKQSAESKQGGSAGLTDKDRRRTYPSSKGKQ